MTGYVHFCQEYFEDVRVPAREPRRRGEPGLVHRRGAARLRTLRHRQRRRHAPLRSKELIDFCHENRSLGQPSMSEPAGTAPQDRRPLHRNRGRAQPLLPHRLDPGGRQGPELRGIHGEGVLFRNSEYGLHTPASRCCSCTGRCGKSDRWAKMEARFGLGDDDLPTTTSAAAPRRSSGTSSPRAAWACRGASTNGTTPRRTCLPCHRRRLRHRSGHRRTLRRRGRTVYLLDKNVPPRRTRFRGLRRPAGRPRRGRSMSPTPTVCVRASG